VERGDKNYTIGSLLGYIKGCQLYIYFAEKMAADNIHDFEELVKREIEKDPQ
jgi:hypothetical protein